MVSTTLQSGGQKSSSDKEVLQMQNAVGVYTKPMDDENPNGERIDTWVAISKISKRLNTKKGDKQNEQHG